MKRRSVAVPQRGSTGWGGSQWQNIAWPVQGPRLNPRTRGEKLNTESQDLTIPRYIIETPGERNSDMCMPKSTLFTTAHVPINEQMCKQNVAHTYGGILSFPRKNDTLKHTIG